MRTLRLFIQLSRPLFLLGGFLFYALGAGIAKYLGHPINWEIYILGQAWGTLLQLSTHYLNEYFDAVGDINNPNRTLLTGGSGAIGPGKLPRATALWAGVACLAGVASLTFMLIATRSLEPATILVMLLLFAGAFFYSVPPVRLESTGYGELTTSILVANLVPAFALLLQAGDLNRLLAMTTFPLTLLHIAMLLAFDLPDYSSDLKYEKRTLMVRLGWQQGMRMHNILILVAYLLLGIAVTQGLSIWIALPVFLSFPLGLLQIWMMNRIANGGRPNWNALTLTALLLLGLAAYLITFAFWTR